MSGPKPDIYANAPSGWRKKINSIEQNGIDAYYDEQPDDANPYDPDEDWPEYEAWRDGWTLAQREDLEANNIPNGDE